jgi:hypothetical protein
MRVRQSLTALPRRLTINHPRRHELNVAEGASVGSNSTSVHVGLCPSINLLKSNSFEFQLHPRQSTEIHPDREIICG